ncbi:MAG: hypothetical protein SPJ17_02575 [Anaeroplasma sp.]|uniref:hypothetical protein n=1 Tax=Anaeroplasma sp. TaxID=1872523 RepID=UPI002A91F509|nr:hypothetical protein [Anaeroplasma sp.]MDY5982574.1 hypothetical protein [Anaeroplasma sp.]
MQDVMDIYEDYASWKKENSHLIQTLVNKKSKAIVRFSCVIAVVDYLYHRHIDGKKLSEDEEVIFSTGFDYIYDSFMMIDNILQSDFNGDIDLMEGCSQTINLLLYINDFESEITSSGNEDLKKELKKLSNLDEKVNDYLAKRENAPDEYFGILNDLIDDIFVSNNVEIHTVEEIFYEIAIEYDIYQEDDFDMFNEAINRQIEKDRNIDKFI